MSAERKRVSMIKLLVFKDWYLHRWAIAGYLVAAGIPLATLASGTKGSFFVGSILLVTVIVSMGIHLAISAVVIERLEQTLAFVMSLPVSPRQFTAAKFLAVLTMFFLPWLAIVISSFAVIAGSRSLPDGLIPFAAVAMTTLLVSAILVVAAALITESIGWTVGAIVAGNLGFNGILHRVSNTPAVREKMTGDAIVWSEPIAEVLVAEAVLAAALILVAFWVQNRKRDYR